MLTRHLDTKESHRGVFIDLSQLGTLAPIKTFFCQSCGCQQKAFSPAQLSHPQNAVALNHVQLIPPDWLQLKTFCSVCGWVYRKAGVPRFLRWKVERLDDSTCVYCGKRKLPADAVGEWAADHLVPEYQGGKTNIENLVLCCRTCNSKKGTRGMVPRYGRYKK